MKGKPILVPIKEPEEGMKVEYCKSIEEVGSFLNNQVYLKDFDFEDWVDLSELQQIAIEYEGELDKTVVNKDNPIVQAFSPHRVKHTILLSPDMYEKALPLIGQEVDFTLQNFWIEDKGKQKDGFYMAIPHFEETAVLITPSPIVYTEEEIGAYKLITKMFNRLTEKYPDLLTDKPLYTEEEVKLLTATAYGHGKEGGLWSNWWDKHKKKQS